MSEMVDRAAKASFDAFAKDGETWDDLSEDWKEVYRKETRAAIKAMREPTSMMIGAAMIQPHPSVSESGGIIQQGEAAVCIDWQAMIDEALR